MRNVQNGKKEEKKTEKNFTGIERTATVASSYFLG
jgi:hypothetical protein